MKDEDLLLLAGGYYFLTTAGLGLEKLGNMLNIGVNNLGLGVTNTLGLTNSQMGINSAGTGVSYITSDYNAALDAQRMAGKQPGLISQIQSGLNTPGGWLGAQSVTDFPYQINKFLGWF